MQILFAGFKGKNNSSKLILDHLRCAENNKLYLTNSYRNSVRELEEKLSSDEYDFAVILGQRPSVSNDSFMLETVAEKGGHKRITEFPIEVLVNNLQKLGHNAKISTNAGYWLCSNVYYYGLKFATENQLTCKILFIHIPKYKKITEFKNFAKVLQDSIETSVK